MASGYQCTIPWQCIVDIGRKRHIRDGVVVGLVHQVGLALSGRPGHLNTALWGPGPIPASIQPTSRPYLARSHSIICQAHGGIARCCSVGYHALPQHCRCCAAAAMHKGQIARCLTCTYNKADHARIMPLIGMLAVQITAGRVCRPHLGAVPSHGTSISARKNSRVPRLLAPTCSSASPAS